MSEIVLNKKETEFLCKLYDEQHLAVDRLPYTEEFNAIVQAFRKEFPDRDFDHYDTYIVLVYLRKNGTLPRKTDKGRRKELPNKPIGGFLL